MLKKIVCLVIAAASMPVGGSNADESADAQERAISEAVAVIEGALTLAKNEPSAQQRIECLRVAADEVRAKCPKNVLVAELFQAAVASADGTDKAPSSDELERALRGAGEILRFRIKMEAKLPAGFPEPTPVGEIRLKEYPGYRMARAKSKKDSAFFTLFTHITMNRIEMTAPVEMTYSADDKEPLKQIDMAFLYGEPSLGNLGKKLGGVVVQDIPPITTVSMGLKGDSDRTKLDELVARLEEWLARQAPEFVRDGNVRLMGYNSPQVPADSRYYEVEIPVKKK